MFQSWLEAAGVTTGEGSVIRLVIIGAGGHGRELLDIVEAINVVRPTFEFVGFLDDGPGPWDRVQRRGASVLGPVDRLAESTPTTPSASARPRTGAASTRSPPGPAAEAATLVHPQATIASDVRAAPGLVMAAGSRITTNVTVGRHVHLNLNATLSHDCEVGSYSMLNPGAHVSGEVGLGESVVVGSGAVVREGCRVGNGTVIGAGAVVLTDLPAGLDRGGCAGQGHRPQSLSVRILQAISDTDRRGAQMFAVYLGDALAELGHAVSTVALATGTMPETLDLPVLDGNAIDRRALRALRRQMAESDVTIAHGSSTLPACAIAGLGPGRPFVYRQISDPEVWSATPLRRLRSRLALSRAAMSWPCRTTTGPSWNAISASSRDGARSSRMRFRLRCSHPPVRAGGTGAAGARSGGRPDRPLRGHAQLGEGPGRGRGGDRPAGRRSPGSRRRRPRAR